MRHTSASESATAVNRQTSRLAKRLSFRGAVEAGSNLSQASRTAGVSRETGRRWRKHMQDGTFDNTKSAASCIGKEESTYILTSIARSQNESAAYRIKAIDLCAELQGTKAPARSIVETRIVPDSVVAWLDGMNTYPDSQKSIGESVNTPILPPHSPNPKESISISTPLKISTISDKADTESAVTVDAIDVSDELDKEDK